MRNGLAGIDHVVIGVRDLERARMGWTRLGFTLTPRGCHLGQGTANYCVMFAGITWSCSGSSSGTSMQRASKPSSHAAKARWRSPSR